MYKKEVIGEVLPDKKPSNIPERPKLSIQEQIEYMRDEKGILFNIVDESHAAAFLESHNYYFKLKAFKKNFPKYSQGENVGKYEGLEFAYLKELSTLDMYLREIVLTMALDVEHYLKVRLLKDLSENDAEDGYSIVSDFFAYNPGTKDSINEKAKNSYCENLVHKYSEAFAVWNIVEVLSFGDLINLCDLYYSRYPAKDIRISNFRIVRFIRNAAAHNNCLINNLADNSGDGFSRNREVNNYVASIDTISTKVREKKMGNRTVHDFIVLLYCFSRIVSSPDMKRKRIASLKDLFDGRFLVHKDYFQDNALLCSNYIFVKKVVDKMATECI